jgi:uncharacterized protein (DUF608 family)
MQTNEKCANFNETSMTSLSTHTANTWTKLSYGTMQLFAANFNTCGHQLCRQTHVWQSIVANGMIFFPANLPQQCVMHHSTYAQLDNT